MQIYIGSAKIMGGSCPSGITLSSTPAFQAEADKLAGLLAAYTPEELKIMLNTNHQLAVENWNRYQNFLVPSTRCQAVFNYDGIVFKKLAPESMGPGDLAYANSHLLIGSFLYGMLRPLDLINPYRLEGDVRLPALGGDTIFNFWKPILTDWFISKVKDDDGILVNLASAEFKDILDWKRVEKELVVITPDFKVHSGGRLKSIVVYTKMCRGAMTRWILLNRIKNVDDLANFEYEGFAFEQKWKYILHG